MSGSILNKLNNIGLKELRSLVAYERFPNRNHIISKKTKNKINELTIEQRVQTILDKQKPLTSPMLVWRGQVENNEIIPHSWFSTTIHKDIAKYYSANQFLFKIHLQPGIKCIDLYKVFKSYGLNNPFNSINVVRKLLENNKYEIHRDDNYKDFGEIIVNGGGKFWKDILKSEEGFKLIKHTITDDHFGINNFYIYETYYFPDNLNKKNIINKTNKRKRPQIAPNSLNKTNKRKRPQIAPNE